MRVCSEAAQIGPDPRLLIPTILFGKIGNALKIGKRFREIMN
jgi:hypothetical protein